MNHLSVINKNVFKIVQALEKKPAYLNELKELTKISSKNNLIKNLSNLEKFKAIKKEKKKHNTFYSINYDNRFAVSLLNVINRVKIQGLPFERRAAIDEVINGIKPNLVILFGSTAKGEFKKDSDVDLLLVYNHKKGDLSNIKSISSEYGVKINPVLMRFAELDLKNNALRHILKTGFPVIGAEYFYEVFKYV